ncbi:MAG: hypothetical protein HZC37_18560 [Burkholderiales bacterium]|nr:hypothetical protein [Burkholderiales bacterium]
MRTTLRAASIVFAAVMAAASAQVAQVAHAADEPSPSHGQAPGNRSRLEQSLERAARAAARGIEHGLQAAEHGVRVGVAAAARGIERGAQATARAADHVARQLERALPPAPPAGSERTGDMPAPGQRGRSDA